MVTDAIYEISAAFSVTKASDNEKQGKLLENIEKINKWLKDCKYFLRDKAYDSRWKGKDGSDYRYKELLEGRERNTLILVQILTFFNAIIKIQLVLMVGYFLA